jgi:hypothetical protein
MLWRALDRDIAQFAYGTTSNTNEVHLLDIENKQTENRIDWKGNYNRH